MRGKSLGKIGLEFGGKIGLGCGEKVKEREFSKNLRQHIYLEKKKPPLMRLLTWKWVRTI